MAGKFLGHLHAVPAAHDVGNEGVPECMKVEHLPLGIRVTEETRFLSPAW